MSQTLESTNAQRDAADAAARAGVDVVLLDDMDELTAVSSLVADVWQTGPDDAQLPAELLRALEHAGNYIAGAYGSSEVSRGDRTLVGAIVGFLGLDADGPYLHSHILGVTKQRRGGNIGYALKQHQRAWALQRGMRKVTWTFDPLVRKNAHFNLQKLGAYAAEYHARFYGAMSDGLNVGDESDRLLVEWRLTDERTTAAASGRLHEPAEPNGIVALSAGEGAEPRAGSVAGDVVLCATPDDIIAVRRTDPERALRWRLALRDTLGAALHDGYAVTGFTRAGWYVLARNG